MHLLDVKPSKIIASNLKIVNLHECHETDHGCLNPNKFDPKMAGLSRAHPDAIEVKTIPDFQHESHNFDIGRGVEMTVNLESEDSIFEKIIFPSLVLVVILAVLWGVFNAKICADNSVEERARHLKAVQEVLKLREMDVKNEFKKKR